MKILCRVIVLFLVILAIHPKENIDASANNDIVSITKALLGVPYRYGGTTSIGFDCSGFARFVFDKMGISLPRTSGEQFNAGAKVSKSELQVGDLVFFAGTYKSGISHSGIYIGNNQFISATSSRGIAIDSLSSSYWAPKFVSGTRVLETKVETLPAGQFHDVPQSHLSYEAISDLSKSGI